MILLAFCLFLFCCYLYVIKSEDDSAKGYLCLAIIYLLPSAALAIAYLASLKVDQLAGFFGLTIYLAHTAGIALLYGANLIPRQNIGIINQLTMSIGIVVFIHGGFFNMRFKMDTLTRSIWLLIECSAINIVKERLVTDESDAH